MRTRLITKDKTKIAHKKQTIESLLCKPLKFHNKIIIKKFLKSSNDSYDISKDVREKISDVTNY